MYLGIGKGCRTGRKRKIKEDWDYLCCSDDVGKDKVGLKNKLVGKSAALLSHAAASNFSWRMDAPEEVKILCRENVSLVDLKGEVWARLPRTILISQRCPKP